MPTVLENLKRIIRDRGLKKKYVAEKAGYTQQQFSELINGKRVIRDADICKLCDALEVTPNDLLERSE